MFSLKSAVALLMTLAVSACSPEPVKKAPKLPFGHVTLQPFASDAALRTFLKTLPPLVRSVGAEFAPPPAFAPDIVIQTEAPPPVNAIVDGNTSITNNQVAGVDEGDIVKSHGDTLIVLRRGRLFTISVAGGRLKPVDAINAYPPGVDAQDDWYDELLVGADRVIVIGFSYGRGGTEINRFRIDAAGHLTYEDTYQIRSNDYFSARNYASRLVGSKLVFYTPLYVRRGGDAIDESLPALRRWTGGKSRFERVGAAPDVYRSPGLVAEQIEALHSVMFCDITTAVLSCQAKSAFGPAGRVFFVSTEAVYVWTVQRWVGEEAYKRPTGMLYRLPLDGSAPAAVGVRGAPTDQFSFREADGALDVLITATSVGDSMWASENSGGSIALVHIPRAAFGDGAREVPFERYRALTGLHGETHYGLQNRFVGDHVLYGLGSGWSSNRGGAASLFVAPVSGGKTVRLTLPHGIERIEAMGRDAVVVGSKRADVVFSSVVLTGKLPALGDRYVLAGVSQGETRSHGFFFHPEGQDDGVLGLPVSRPNRPGYRQLFEESAAVVFVRRSAGTFTLLGELPSEPDRANNDHCVASCVDWYGNSRPIFFGRRTFALMGYEMVEGELGKRDMSEKARVNFNPAAPVRN